MSRRDGDFLARWSARKQKARTEPEALPEPEPEVAPPAAPEQAAVAPLEPAEPEKTDEELLRELGLPDPDSLMKGDNIAAFLKSEVPARLRNRALRRLWLTDPVFANLDGLNDYEEDFTDAATVVEGMKTAYRPGRGFLPDEPDETVPEGGADVTPDAEAPQGAVEGGEAEEGDDRETEAVESAEEPDAAEELRQADPAEPGASELEDAQTERADPSDAPTDEAGEPAAMELPRARRMRFRFDVG